jgi:hypothetical protein
MDQQKHAHKPVGNWLLKNNRFLLLHNVSTSMKKIRNDTFNSNVSNSFAKKQSFNTSW